MSEEKCDLNEYIVGQFTKGDVLRIKASCLHNVKKSTATHIKIGDKLAGVIYDTGVYVLHAGCHEKAEC